MRLHANTFAYSTVGKRKKKQQHNCPAKVGPRCYVVVMLPQELRVASLHSDKKVALLKDHTPKPFLSPQNTIFLQTKGQTTTKAYGFMQKLF